MAVVVGSRARAFPFAGLVVCVTGLIKEAKQQVQEATEAMGGVYSPDLHPRCTHLVVHICSGRKLEHALRHGLKRGLFVVTLAWFVNCTRQHARLDEQLYSVIPHFLAPSLPLSLSSERFCLPPSLRKGKVLVQAQVQALHFAGACFFLDPDLGLQMEPQAIPKLAEAAQAGGGKLLQRWFMGCPATHVVCEAASLPTYLGFNTHLVSPTWLLKSAKEKQLQRCVHLSVDLSRHLAWLLAQGGSRPSPSPSPSLRPQQVLELQQQRREEMAAAKAGVRRRRSQGRPFRPFTPSALLETVCWSVTQPADAAIVAVEGGLDQRWEDQAAPLGTDFVTRPMTESEKWEVVYNPTFLTILFPIDQLDEMGVTSKTFVSATGFTRLQILESISQFYEDFLSAQEVEVAIQTDSRLADRLRSSYASKASVEAGCVSVRRSEFLGNRKNFEGLKKVGQDSTCRLYQLVIGA